MHKRNRTRDPQHTDAPVLKHGEPPVARTALKARVVTASTVLLDIERGALDGLEGPIHRGGREQLEPLDEGPKEARGWLVKANRAELDVGLEVEGDPLTLRRLIRVGVPRVAGLH